MQLDAMEMVREIARDSKAAFEITPDADGKPDLEAVRGELLQASLALGVPVHVSEPDGREALWVRKMPLLHIDRMEWWLHWLSRKVGGAKKLRACLSFGAWGFVVTGTFTLFVEHPVAGVILMALAPGLAALVTFVVRH